MTGQKLPVPSNSGGAAAQVSGGLAAGIRTGGFKAAPPTGTGPATAGAATGTTATLPSTDGLVVYENGVTPSSPLKGLVIKAAILASVIGLGVFVAKKVGGAIDSATAESVQAQDAFAKARSESENQALQEKHEQTLQQVDKANARAADQMLDEALASFRAGKYEAALSGLRALLSEYPKRDEAEKARLYEGKALLALGRASEARKALTGFIEKHPGSSDYPEALVRRGQAAAKSADLAAAISDFTSLLTQHTGSPFATEARLERGLAYATRGDVADATSDLETVAGALGPSDPLYARAKQALISLRAR
jgi:TolA-binding protein